MSVETDRVLSAIRRGEDSLPKLRTATGLDYAQLHVILHKLEYEWHSIDSTETVQGFQRFTVKGSEALSEVAHIDPEQPKPSSNGHKAPVKADARQGPAYKPLDLAEVEEVMATTDTIAAGAAKLGLTNMQLYTRRQKDEEVHKAVERGRERYYATAPDETEDEPAEVCVDCGGPRCPTSGQRCRQCYLKRAEAKREGLEWVAKSGENITETITKEGQVSENSRNVQSCDFPAAGPNETRALPDFAPPMMVEKPAMAQVQVMGGLRLHEDIEIRVSEMRNWPAERISEFFDAVAKVIEIPQRPHVRTDIAPAWSPAFESSAGDPEGILGLTTLYLVSLLHHNMEPHEKEAVWTLLQYLKRIEAYVEQQKEQKIA